MSPPATTPGGPRTGPRRRPGEFGGGSGGGGGRKFTPRRKVCQFCVDKVKEVDYKDLGRLRRFLSERGKIEPRRKTGTCAAHQRSLNVALKRARQLALLPFTAEHIRITGVVVREPGAAPFRGSRGPRPVDVDGAEPPVDGATAVAEAAPVVVGEPVADGEAVPAATEASLAAESPAAEGVLETAASGPAT